MAITLTWSVKDLHKVTATGAVYKAEWSCSGVDADTKISHIRSGSYLHMGEVTADEVTGIDADGNNVIKAVTRTVPVTPDHTASGFTAYASLAEADVLVWCKAGGVGTENEALITTNITNKIAAQVNSTGMPWAAE